MTINEALVLGKAVRERLNELKQLRSQVSTKENRFFGSENTSEVVPMYDVKAVDKKCVELEKFLFLIDTRIKQSNAVTEIKMEIDVDKLLDPLA